MRSQLYRCATTSAQDYEHMKTSSQTFPGVSSAGLYAVYIEILLLLYAVVPLPLYGTLAIGKASILSIEFESHLWPIQIL